MERRPRHPDRQPGLVSVWKSRVNAQETRNKTLLKPEHYSEYTANKYDRKMTYTYAVYHSFLMGYLLSDLFLTHPPAPPTMQPESSDGLASVGTILPEEGAALLPGGSFRFMAFAGRLAKRG